MFNKGSCPLPPNFTSYGAQNRQKVDKFGISLSVCNGIIQNVKNASHFCFSVKPKIYENSRFLWVSVPISYSRTIYLSIYFFFWNFSVSKLYANSDFLYEVLSANHVKPEIKFFVRIRSQTLPKWNANLLTICQSWKIQTILNIWQSNSDQPCNTQDAGTQKVFSIRYY